MRLFKQVRVNIAWNNFSKLLFKKIDHQPQIPKNEANHYQADSVIGKSTDKKAIASTIDVNTGKVTLNLYNGKAILFAMKISSRIGKDLKNLRIDNGSKNSKIGNYLPIQKIFTCHSCSSWEKDPIESMQTYSYDMTKR